MKKFETIVPPEVAATQLSNADWLVVDTRFDLADPELGREMYRKAHIPGALYAHLDDDLAGTIDTSTGRHPLPGREALLDTFSRWGIDSTKQVVAYDDASGAFAARLWWLLRWLGHRAVAVLDGGLSAWVEEGYPTDDQAVEALATSFDIGPTSRVTVTTTEVEHIRGANDACLFDARAHERFRGEVEPIDSIAGHIPGAINFPFQRNLDQHGRLLPADRLAELYRSALGDISPDAAVCMCGSGVTACHNLLAMEHGGLKGARLYVGSWSEWITDPDRPVDRGP